MQRPANHAALPNQPPPPNSFCSHGPCSVPTVPVLLPQPSKQKRKFSSFFKSLVIELDKDLYGPDNHLVEVRPRRHIALELLPFHRPKSRSPISCTDLHQGPPWSPKPHQPRWACDMTQLFSPEQWHRTPTTQETDGFQVKRPGDLSVRCTLLLMLDYQVCVSPPPCGHHEAFGPPHPSLRQAG